MSRVAGLIDLFVPSDHTATIAVGQHCVAGETIIAMPASKLRAKTVTTS